MARFSAVIAFLLVAQPLAAQAVWRQTDALKYVTGPLAWDATRSVAWHVGVVDGAMQTAAWDGLRWNVVASNAPPAREAHGLAYDPLRARLVLFGGRDLAHTQVYRDTWDFDGVTWTLRATGGPGARCLFPMCWHAGRNTVVIACGTSSPSTPWGTALADVWEWNGSAWSQRIGLSEGRIAPALGHDPVRDELVLCGGHAVVGWPNPMPWSFDETWTFGAASTRWSLRGTSVSAGRRSAAALTFDPLRARLQLLGGSDLGGGGPDPLSGFASPIGAIVEWSGSDWVMNGGLPSFAVALGAAFDPLRSELIAFGGDWLLERGDATWLRDVNLAWRRASDGTPHSLEAVTWDGARARFVGLEPVAWPGSGYRTYEWDGTAFAQRADANALGITRFATLAWHSQSLRCVAFGTTAGALHGNETWVWDGASWTDAQPATRPSPRRDPALAADPSRGVLVLFGGWGPGPFGGSIPLADTWEWNGSTWTQSFTAHTPSPRADAAMSFCSRRNAVVLYGGNAPSPVGEVWVYDGVDWTSAAPPATAPIFDHSLCDDVARARLVLAGRSNSSALDRETWEWDGAAWTRVALGDPRSSNVGPQALRLAYDDSGERVLAYFERALWRYETPHQATVTAYGGACASSAGTLLLAASDRPWLGDTLHGTLGPVPLAAAAAVFVGASDARWGNATLPFALDPLGAPGCTLWAEPILLLAPPLGTSHRNWSLALPMDPSLAGASAYAQGVALDPLANPFGLALSAGLALRLGVR
ncbi:MAG: hypothetical protein HZB39_20645 [Planctomycetes bacterium]|nr:hypothetical protein [Planctomycetota bacterium]